MRQFMYEADCTRLTARTSIWTPCDVDACERVAHAVQQSRQQQRSWSIQASHCPSAEAAAGLQWCSLGGTLPLILLRHHVPGEAPLQEEAVAGHGRGLHVQPPALAHKLHQPHQRPDRGGQLAVGGALEVLLAVSKGAGWRQRGGESCESAPRRGGDEAPQAVGGCKFCTIDMGQLDWVLGVVNAGCRVGRVVQVTL